MEQKSPDSPTPIFPKINQFCAAHRHPTFLGDVRKLVKIPKSMGFPVDAVRLENQGVWFLFCRQNHAARIKIQAERRAGEALVVLRPKRGDRKSKSHRGTVIVRLKDLGITRN
jgi:hypothetical protein